MNLVRENVNVVINFGDEGHMHFLTIRNEKRIMLRSTYQKKEANQPTSWNGNSLVDKNGVAPSSGLQFPTNDLGF